MADAFPMIQQGMRLQKQGGLSDAWEHFGFFACPDCHHEVTQRDTILIFDCNWCGKEAIAPVWITPKDKDGEIVLDVSGETYTSSLLYCDVG